MQRWMVMGMARPIDADRYAEVLERYINAPHVKVFGKYSDGMQIAISTCIELLNAQRTLDAVEVVRCKDCKHYGCELTNYIGRTQQFCNLHKGLVVVDRDSFCSYGERKDNERKAD